MKRILFIVLILVFAQAVHAGNPPAIRRGVWVSVFSEKRVLYSQDAAVELINACKEAGIDEIYLQIYQGGKAFYDTGLLDPAKYQDMLKSAGRDQIDFIISEAGKNNIKVFAWVNILSVGQNGSADIIKKFGSGVLTRDQFLRPSGRKNPNESDKFYLREDQVFLEPGDQRVGKFTLAILDEIFKRYPNLSGVHLDYIRYPMTVPFIPSAKFYKSGLVYGYGEKNIEHFKSVVGLDPLTGLKKDSDFLKWDNWKRQQINILVKRISKRLKEKDPEYLVSCAVIPSAERAYASMYQDWPLWLEDGFVDYVVLMNYTLDEQLTSEIIRAGLGLRGKGKVYIGIGAFLLKDSPTLFNEKYKLVKSLNPDGIVVFSYDDLTPGLVAYLKE
jgi:uncharacterized lipoprotein YddW (UPF0748 family)